MANIIETMIILRMTSAMKKRTRVSKGLEDPFRLLVSRLVILLAQRVVSLHTQRERALALNCTVIPQVTPSFRV